MRDTIWRYLFILIIKTRAITNIDATSTPTIAPTRGPVLSKGSVILRKAKKSRNSWNDTYEWIYERKWKQQYELTFQSQWILSLCIKNDIVQIMLVLHFSCIAVTTSKNSFYLITVKTQHKRFSSCTEMVFFFVQNIYSNHLWGDAFYWKVNLLSLLRIRLKSCNQSIERSNFMINWLLIFVPFEYFNHIGIHDF